MPESENEHELNMKIYEVILIIAYLSLSILLCGSDSLIHASGMPSDSCQQVAGSRSM